MIIVRCTQKLLKLSKVKPEPDPGEPDAPLGEWYANVVSLAHPGKSAVMYTHNPSRLTVIVEGKSVNTTMKEFHPRLLVLLFRLGASDALIARQEKGMEEVRIGKTASRSMLGSMNEIAYIIEGEATRAGRIEHLSFNGLELKLSDFLFGSKAVGKDYFKPVEYLENHIF